MISGTWEDPKVGQSRREPEGAPGTTPACFDVSADLVVEAGLGTTLLVQPVAATMASATPTARIGWLGLAKSGPIDRSFIRLSEHLGLSQRHAVFLFIGNNRVPIECPFNVKVGIIPCDGAFQFGTIKLGGFA